MSELTDRLYGPGRVEPQDVSHCSQCLGMRWFGENGGRHIEITECEQCVAWLRVPKEEK